MRMIIARLFIGPVFLFNIQCGLVFLASPESYMSGFELAGVPGREMVRALGLLFLMWNVPYGVALFQPFRFRVSLIQAIVMQAIGLVGETYMLLGLSAAHETLRATAVRFIQFDGFGLAALVAAYWLLRGEGSANHHQD